jgi:hypothetical protein
MWRLFMSRNIETQRPRGQNADEKSARKQRRKQKSSKDGALGKIAELHASSVALQSGLGDSFGEQSLRGEHGESAGLGPLHWQTRSLLLWSEIFLCNVCS